MIATAETVTAKPRKSRSAKTQISKAADKVKVSLVLSAEVDFKLSVHAAAMRMDRSALVNQVLADALKRFVVQDRQRQADDPSETNGSAI